MSSYSTTERASNGTPTPDMLNPAAAARELRDRLQAATRAADIARSERRQAIEARDGARAELAAVHTVLVAALGGPSAVAPGATTVDLATALARELSYARGAASKAHARRRVNEALTERLLAELGHAMRPDATPSPRD